MARRKKQKFTASFDNVGAAFKDSQEYLVKVDECSLEEGDSAPYYSFKLVGTGDHAGSTMYHNASLATGALWRTRDVFEAFLGEVPEGDFDPEDYVDEFIGKHAMCSTFADTYDGQKRIKPEDFWPAEGEIPDDGGDEEVDLDDLDDEDIKKVGKAMGIKSKRASTIRKELEDADEDELLDALKELGLIDDDDDGDAGGGDFDLDNLDDDQIKALAEAMDIKVTSRSRVSTLKKKLAAMDEDELAEAFEELDEEGGDDEVTAEAISKMNQDELEALVEEHELDVDLDDYKTLRKKRTAVVDAAEEAEILADD